MLSFCSSAKDLFHILLVCSYKWEISKVDTKKVFQTFAYLLPIQCIYLGSIVYKPFIYIWCVYISVENVTDLSSPGIAQRFPPIKLHTFVVNFSNSFSNHPSWDRCTVHTFFNQNRVELWRVFFKFVLFVIHNKHLTTSLSTKLFLSEIYIYYFY